MGCIDGAPWRHRRLNALSLGIAAAWQALARRQQAG